MAENAGQLTVDLKVDAAVLEEVEALRQRVSVLERKAAALDAMDAAVAAARERGSGVLTQAAEAFEAWRLYHLEMSQE